MKELLELVARALVDDPDQVDVTEVVEGDTVVLELRVAPDDLGKVIGKQGKTARALRTLLASAGAARDKRVVFEIIEE